MTQHDTATSRTFLKVTLQLLDINLLVYDNNWAPLVPKHHV